jgi:uncharacterized membrane protein YfcA
MDQLLVISHSLSVISYLRSVPEFYFQFEFWLLMIAGFAAGFVDSIVGGGGLIQLPAFLLAFPNLAPAMILGSNKFAGFSGTTLAAIRYVRNTPVQWRAIGPAIITALICGWIGAALVQYLDKEMVRPIILGLLIAVAIYTYIKKDFGITNKQGVQGNAVIVWSLLTGAVLGLYDGFFGPGTGSFLIVIYVAIFGFDFLNASVSAKLVNCATNVAALAAFIWTDSIVWEIAIPLAIFNMTGAWLGVKTALKRGREFVRVFFLAVVSAMILKFAYDVCIEYLNS